jgi:hypothetical protein
MQLIGVEYMITADAYKNLPDREKPNWHYHNEEFAPNRADPELPILSEQQQNATLKKLEESFGKVIITWNPNDKAPIFPPQEILVQHPFMVNTTVSPVRPYDSTSFFWMGNTLQIEGRLLQSINLMACILTSPSFLIGEYFLQSMVSAFLMLALEDNITT